MGLCREFPTSYLGDDHDSWSFWFDDGDAYQGDTRVHAGQLEISVPMGVGDSVGVLVDLRTPGVPLEFVLNRRSTGPCRRTEHVFCEGAPNVHPCVSFCSNHPGCTVALTHLGEPPDDIAPFDGDPKPSAEAFRRKTAEGSTVDLEAWRRRHELGMPGKSHLSG